MEVIHNEDGITLEDRIAVMRNKMWGPELEKLLRLWKRTINIRQKGHQELAQKYRQRHYFLGLPAMIISTAISSAAFATFKESERGTCVNGTVEAAGTWSVQEWIRLFIGVFNIISLILAGIMTFMNYQEEAENNKNVATDYDDLSQTIDGILSMPSSLRGDPVTTVKDIKDRYTTINKKAPSLPKHIQRELSSDMVRPMGDRSLFSRQSQSNPISSAALRPEDVTGIENVANSPPIRNDSKHSSLPQDLDLLQRVIASDETTPKKTDRKFDKNKGKIDEKRKSFKNSFLIRSEKKKDNSPEKSEELYEEKYGDELCISFDIDQTAMRNNAQDALCRAQEDRRIQDSYLKALEFEMNRMSASTPRQSDKITGHSTNILAGEMREQDFVVVDMSPENKQDII